MKKIQHLVLILFFFPLYIQAQQDHFIYLQTENYTPFYIKTGNQILSSSAAGYLILSKLRDGDYKMIIGSPKNEWSEQQVSYKVENKDAGYLIKNFGDNKLGLFNLQSYHVTMAENVVAVKTKEVTQNNDDAFSNMLANVVNDSTIKQKDVVVVPPVAVKEKEKVVQEQPKEKPEVAEPPKTPEEKTGVVGSVIVESSIKRKLRKKGKDGTELIYTDEYDNNKDTIRIFIPAEKAEEVAKDEIKINDTSKQDNKTDSLVQKNKDLVMQADTVKLVPVETPKKTVTEQKPVSQPVFIEDQKSEKRPASGLTINSDCKTNASDDDFFKLRKKMAAEKNDEAMVKVAKKVFKTRCFSTDQVKNLSSLFLKDEGRYNFFDAAYPFVSDSAVFPSLENQLTDPYYITRFKAMIHH
jgi:hypothetical protein